MTYFATDIIVGSNAAAALTGTLPLRRPPPGADQTGELLCDTGRIIFASGVNLAINDVIELAVLPEDCVLVDWILCNDDFDSNTTLQVRIGLMTGAPGDAGRALATVGAELLATGSTTLQAAAITRGSVAAKIGAYRIAPTGSPRSIGMGIEAAPTNIASIRQLDFIMFYRAARYGA